MREEISEPQHWRSSNQRNASRNASWSSRRRSQEHDAELAAEAVDAAMTAAAMTEQVDCAETTDASNFITSDIISSLATQLDLLEKQREQLQQLLVQAQAKH